MSASNEGIRALKGLRLLGSLTKEAAPNPLNEMYGLNLPEEGAKAPLPALAKAAPHAPAPTGAPVGRTGMPLDPVEQHILNEMTNSTGRPVVPSQQARLQGLTSPAGSDVSNFKGQPTGGLNQRLTLPQGTSNFVDRLTEGGAGPVSRAQPVGGVSARINSPTRMSPGTPEFLDRLTTEGLDRGAPIVRNQPTGLAQRVNNNVGVVPQHVPGARDNSFNGEQTLGQHNYPAHGQTGEQQIWSQDKSFKPVPEPAENYTARAPGVQNLKAPVKNEGLGQPGAVVSDMDPMKAKPAPQKAPPAANTPASSSEPVTESAPGYQRPGMPTPDTEVSKAYSNRVNQERARPAFRPRQLSDVTPPKEAPVQGPEMEPLSQSAKAPTSRGAVQGGPGQTAGEIPRPATQSLGMAEPDAAAAAQQQGYAGRSALRSQARTAPTQGPEMPPLSQSAKAPTSLPNVQAGPGQTAGEIPRPATQSLGMAEPDPAAVARQKGYDVRRFDRGMDRVSKLPEPTAPPQAPGTVSPEQSTLKATAPDPEASARIRRFDRGMDRVSRLPEPSAPPATPGAAAASNDVNIGELGLGKPGPVGQPGADAMAKLKATGPTPNAQAMSSATPNLKGEALKAGLNPSSEFTGKPVQYGAKAAPAAAAATPEAVSAAGAAANTEPTWAQTFDRGVHALRRAPAAVGDWISDTAQPFVPAVNAAGRGLKATGNALLHPVETLKSVPGALSSAGESIAGAAKALPGAVSGAYEGAKDLGNWALRNPSAAVASAGNKALGAGETALNFGKGLAKATAIPSALSAIAGGVGNLSAGGGGMDTVREMGRGAVKAIPFAGDYLADKITPAPSTNTNVDYNTDIMGPRTARGIMDNKTTGVGPSAPQPVKPQAPAGQAPQGAPVTPPAAPAPLPIPPVHSAAPLNLGKPAPVGDLAPGAKDVKNAVTGAVADAKDTNPWKGHNKEVNNMTDTQQDKYHQSIGGMSAKDIANPNYMADLRAKNQTEAYGRPTDNMSFPENTGKADYLNKMKKPGSAGDDPTKKDSKKDSKSDKPEKKKSPAKKKQPVQVASAGEKTASYTIVELPSSTVTYTEPDFLSSLLGL